MITTSLPPEEYWFYRVTSEITLALLHKINNELTGVIFQVENLQELAEEGGPLSEQTRDLGQSLNGVLGLIRHSVSLQREVQENPVHSIPLTSLLGTGVPLLRMVLPKSMQLVAPPPESDPWIRLAEEDFLLVLAAGALLLHPPGSHPGGVFHLVPGPVQPGRATLHLQVQSADYTTHALFSAAAAPWAALQHRLRRLGCSAEPPMLPHQDFLALHLPTTAAA